MNLEPRAIVRRTLITEKGAQTREQGKVGKRYHFDVHPDANKIQIAHAIKAIFGVDVVSVRTLNLAGKLKRLGRSEGRRSHWKKAVVTLKIGQKIDIFEEV